MIIMIISCLCEKNILYKYILDYGEKERKERFLLKKTITFVFGKTKLKVKKIFVRLLMMRYYTVIVCVVTVLQVVASLLF